jgi:acyl transferase domain-containing protein
MYYLSIDYVISTYCFGTNNLSSLNIYSNPIELVKSLSFEAAFFNITATDSISFNPKQRTSMEVMYEALENAGIARQHIVGTQNACYISSLMSDYPDVIVRDFSHNSNTTSLELAKKRFQTVCPNLLTYPVLALSFTRHVLRALSRYI